MTTGLWAMIGVFFGLFVLRVPIFIVLLAAAATGMLLAPSSIPIATAPSVLWQSVNTFALLSVPFFILMGDLALVSGVTRRLVDVARVYIGHVRGGLAHVSVTVNMIMAGMSGSDLADAAATGRLLIPAMRQANYPAGYAASIIAGAAMLGPLVPPSVAFLLYAAATNQSVGRMFLAGAVPGFLLAGLLMVHAYIVARIKKHPVVPAATMRERAVVTFKGLPVLMIPFIVLGSFFGGVATPTEAAVIGVLAVLVVGMAIHRELTLEQCGAQLASTARTVGSIFIIIAASAVFGRVLTLYGAADGLSRWVITLTTDPMMFLIGINLVYLVLGCLVDTVPVLLVFVPLLMPTVLQLGIDPVHFGVITVFNLLIGLVTPPYGLTMFLLCRIANISIIEFWKHMWPIFLTMLLALAIVTAFPQVSLWLPNLMLPVR